MLKIPLVKNGKGQFQGSLQALKTTNCCHTVHKLIPLEVICYETFIFQVQRAVNSNSPHLSRCNASNVLY